MVSSCPITEMDMGCRLCPFLIVTRKDQTMADETTAALHALIRQVSTLTDTVEKQNKQINQRAAAATDPDLTQLFQATVPKRQLHYRPAPVICRGQSR